MNVMALDILHYFTESEQGKILESIAEAIPPGGIAIIRDAVRDGSIRYKLTAAQDALTEKVAARYPKLTEDEIKTLVVDDKWLGTLAAAVQGELDRVSQTLTGRIRQLAERYATPLPQLTDEVAALAARVDGHLKKMGAVWK